MSKTGKSLLFWIVLVITGLVVYRVVDYLVPTT